MTQLQSNSAEFENLVKQIKSLNFDGVLYSFYPLYMYNKKVQPVLRHCETLTPFVKHYLKNDYGNHDFVVRLALQGQQEIDWWEEINAGDVSETERSVTEYGRDNFGIKNGFTIVMPFYKFAVAAVSVVGVSDDAEYFQQIKNTHLATLHKYANEYHESIIDSHKMLQLFINPILDKLNDTAKKVLKHTVSGQRMQDIEGVSTKYAEKVLSGLRDDFGGITTNELIHMLGATNLYKHL